MSKVNPFSVLIFGIILPIIRLVGRIFSNKGSRGEKRVNSKISKLPPEYSSLSDVLLKRPDGSTSQIDHIVVSRNGIFVIETKNYSGKIYGSDVSENWTEYFNWLSHSHFNYGSHSKSYTFYNPVKQNQGHIHTLRILLADFGKLPIYSIIAFSNTADLRVSVSSAEVVHWISLKRTILGHSSLLLSEEQVSGILSEINANRIENTKEAVSQHVSNAKAAKTQKYKRVQNGRCPMSLIEGVCNYPLS